MGVMAALILALLLLRTNVAIVFLSLCAGSVLLATTGANLSLVASSLSSGIDVSTNIARLLLLLVPMAVCAVLLRNHVSKGLLPLSLLIAICTALLTTIFVIPLLSDGIQSSISTTDTWSLLTQYQEPIVVVGLVTSILMISLTVRKPHDKHRRKGRH